MFVGIYNIPNSVTLTGLILSLSASFFSFEKKLGPALICLVYSGLCDLFDGLIARKLNLEKEAQFFGLQLDSLVDLVSFGVVPVLIALHSGSSSLLDYGLFLFYVCCATLRLAYFNLHGTVEKKKTVYYTGLPVTYAALIFPIVYISKVFLLVSLSSILIRASFFLLAFLFLLKIPIPKPTGVFYLLFPIIALFLTYFWLITHNL